MTLGRMLRHLSKWNVSTKQMIVLVDDEFLEKVDYIERINGYKNKSDTVRKTIEKEYRKEKESDVRKDS